MANFLLEAIKASFASAASLPPTHALRSHFVSVWRYGEDAPKVRALGGVSRGKGGKTPHRHTGIRAQKRAAQKARNRARA